MKNSVGTHQWAITERSPQSRYFQMLRIRRIEEAIANHYVEQEIRTPVHLCIGQEAPPVGVMEHLLTSDRVLSGHRSHGHYLAKGGNLRAMIAELYGRVTGCSRGKGGSQHLVDLSCGFLGSAPILASTLSIGVGVSWALKQREPGAVCVVFFGDSATEEGVFHESLSFASLHKLPIVFVCENNLYSTHSNLSVRQPNRPIKDLALAHAVAGFSEDGNSVVAISRLTQEALLRARTGDGPTLLVFDTYRWLEHVGPGSDVNLGYRTQDEIDEWMNRDPLILSGFSSSDAVAGQDSVIAMENAIAEEIADAFAFAQSSPYPEIAELTQHVFPETR